MITTLAPNELIFENWSTQKMLCGPNKRETKPVIKFRKNLQTSSEKGFTSF